MIVYDDLQQGSEDWFNIRKGRPTASQFDKILTPAKCQLSAQRWKYMRKLARECAIDDPHEFSGNKYTDWGNEMEGEAREYFADKYNKTGKQVGFCVQDNEIVGCSPDWLITDDEGNYISGLEIKCPQVDTHVDYLLDGKLPDTYKLQVHGSMAVTGFNHWYFMSYVPGLKELVVKVERDEFTSKVEEALETFLIEYVEERERVLKAITL